MTRYFILATVESQEDESQTVDAEAVAATMPSLDLFSMYSIRNSIFIQNSCLVDDNADTLNSIIMNLQPSVDKDNSYENSKIIDFDHKFHELKENLQKPDELKEYEDFDLKCIETSFHQQQTQLKRKSSNKKNADAILPLGSNETNAVAAAVAVSSLQNKPHGPFQRKRSNVDVDIRPCEPNER